MRRASIITLVEWYEAIADRWAEDVRRNTPCPIPERDTVRYLMQAALPGWTTTITGEDILCGVGRKGVHRTQCRD